MLRPDELRRVRAADKRLTFKRLEELSGIPRRAIQMWERGKKTLDDERLLRLTKAYLVITHPVEFRGRWQVDRFDKGTYAYFCKGRAKSVEEAKMLVGNEGLNDSSVPRDRTWTVVTMVEGKRKVHIVRFPDNPRS